VHPDGYLQALTAAAAQGGAIDADTYVTPASVSAALAAAGGAIAACDAVVGGGAAISVCRPPGHHAEPARPMGFCLLANGAIAVRHAQARHGVGRVAVVDWDVHHGNGTQAVFWEDPSVLAVSLHGWPLWPGTGAADERGAGPGRGTTLNLPLRSGTGTTAYLEAFDRALAAVEAFGPELIVGACGFDAHRDDPLGTLALESDDFGVLVARLRALCETLGIPEPALVLEGGYDLDALAGSAAAVGRAYAETRRG
jgi:acetoin utilization deacetylase AcuC-like enzyme